MKIDQIAFGCANKSIWESFANRAEVVDEVTFSGVFRDGAQFKIIDQHKGFLAFDYEGGIEREYLFYPNRSMTFHGLINDYSETFLSHLASHCDSIDLFLSQHGRCDVVMDVTTNEHTNEKLRELGRKYRYVILDWRQTHGYFYKLIQRIEASRPNPT